VDWKSDTPEAQGLAGALPPRAMPEDEEALALAMDRPDYAARLAALAAKYSQEPDHKACGLALASLLSRTAGADDRRALLARAAVAVYIGGQGRPGAVTKAAELIERMPRSNVARFAEAYATDITAIYDTLEPNFKKLLFTAPLRMSVLNELTERTDKAAAQEFGLGLFLGAGFPRRFDAIDPVERELELGLQPSRDENEFEIDIMARALAGAKFPDDRQARERGELIVRLKALALDSVGRRLFERPELRPEILVLLKDNPGITVATLRREGVRNPFLSSVVAAARLQVNMKDWMAKEAAAKLQVYDSSKLRARFREILPEGKDPEAFYEGIRNAAKSIDDLNMKPRVQLLPVYKTHSDGKIERIDVLARVVYDRHEAFIDTAGKVYSTFRRWEESYRWSFAHIWGSVSGSFIITYPENGHSANYGKYALESL
jgi:hypothetical protein